MPADYFIFGSEVIPIARFPQSDTTGGFWTPYPVTFSDSNAAVYVPPLGVPLVEARPTEQLAEAAKQHLERRTCWERLMEDDDNG